MQEHLSLHDFLKEISINAFSDEQICVEDLLTHIEAFTSRSEDIQARAERYTKSLRENPPETGVETFLQQYKLSSHEGVTIMCLAEALLRIPDTKTANELIYDKLKTAEWDQHLGQSKSLFVNASTWGMMLTGKITSLGEVPVDGAGGVLGKLVSKFGEPLVREALKRAMHIISTQFVLGNTIDEALNRSKDYQEKGYLYSYDMLGEAARSDTQAQVFYQSYLNAIAAIGEKVNAASPLFERPSISIKLSALHPRYELLKLDTVMEELYPRLKTIVTKAKSVGISLSIDAEEAHRHDILLKIFHSLLADNDFSDYDGIGFVLQAYQKRAFMTLEFLLQLSQTYKKRIPIRLVKGAYWDFEIKQAQVEGLTTYPVFTRKSHTDVSYLACAAKILEHPKHLYAQFATHNALSVASILEVATNTKFEFQRLHGMGEQFYDQIVDKVPCRIYAPVGKHEELLPYLIRRLLENGANNSFVNLLLDEEQPINQILADPVSKAIRNEGYSNPATPLPPELYTDRKNSYGYNLGYECLVDELKDMTKPFMDKAWKAAPLVSGKDRRGEVCETFSPFNKAHKVGDVIFASNKHADDALNAAQQAFTEWSNLPVSKRTQMIEKAADLIEENRGELIALCMREGGKTIIDCVAEVREAADFCRYYAAQARKHLEIPVTLNGPTGEQNQLSYHGRGVFICISPWNFPLAIFTGQLVAALLAGNTVITKPAQQTSLIAYYMVSLLHKAGIPPEVLHLLPGKGAVLGQHIIENEHVAGVAFTGSGDVAYTINKTLANNFGPIIPFIAETGGQNAMIVDSSALLEQVIDDVIFSAFGSAGQRCSALRVLYVQQEIADKFITLLNGAIHEIRLGEPTNFSTDIGPVIDNKAKENLLKHVETMENTATLIGKSFIDKEINDNGSFVAPHAFEIDNIQQIPEEVFGPILHVIRYKPDNLDQIIDDINSTGYGLTFGIHSRIGEKINYIKKRINAGNIYVNRSMIGAVVGVQPFGGEGLSGTGPKAGGPNYIKAFCTERSVSINTTAIGGNLALLS